MIIHFNPFVFPGVKNPVITVGTFDGVHLGHQKIIERLKSKAAELGGETVVVTFDQHPRMVLAPDDDSVKLINTNERKYERLRSAGIQHLVILPFTKEFSQLPWQTFIKEIIVDRLGAAWLVIGYDHRFGHDREGSKADMTEMGRQYQFGVEEVDEFIMDGLPVSSTRIRQALVIGNVTEANRLLGYEYSITGKVVHGNRIGHQLGFPTANLEVEDKYKLIAANGVYASRVEYHGRSFLGMSNIGVRPTINDSKFAVEVNIFDFDNEIYGESLTVSFVERVRNELRFDSLQQLSDQLKRDKVNIRNLLVSNNDK